MEKILCVHGDMVSYPTAEVKLQLGRWSWVAKVVVAPDIPVPVLLGTDIYELKPVLVTTRAQARSQRCTASAEEDTDTTDSDSSEASPNDNELNGECSDVSEPADIAERETSEPRREELSTSTSEGPDPLEASADDIRQW